MAAAHLSTVVVSNEMSRMVEAAGLSGACGVSIANKVVAAGIEPAALFEPSIV